MNELIGYIGYVDFLYFFGMRLLALIGTFYLFSRLAAGIREWHKWRRIMRDIRP